MIISKPSSFYFLLTFITTLFLSVGLSSCCNDGDECFEPLEGAIEIKLHFDDRKDPQVRKQFFNSSRDSLKQLDSVFVIKCEKGNLSNHLDTIYHFEKNFFNRTNIFFVKEDFDFDWIYQNDEPFFRHEVTDLSSETERRRATCKCEDLKSASFKFDGEAKTEEDLPLFFDKLD